MTSNAGKLTPSGHFRGHVSTCAGPISTKIFLEFGAEDWGWGGQELGFDRDNDTATSSGIASEIRFRAWHVLTRRVGEVRR